LYGDGNTKTGGKTRFVLTGGERAVKIELRGNGKVHISGYVNVTEKRSRIMTRYGRKFVERVMPGAFEDAVKDAEEEKRAINLKIDHDRVIANTTDGSLKLKEDKVGLYAVADITDAGFEERAEKGEVKGWSFGFYPLKEEYKALYDENGKTGIEERSLEKVKLTEVTLCMSMQPCYEATTFEMRGENESVFEVRGTQEVTEVVKKDEGNNTKGNTKGNAEERGYDERDSKILDGRIKLLKAGI
jgi:hypothetical protein